MLTRRQFLTLGGIVLGGAAAGAGARWLLGRRPAGPAAPSPAATTGAAATPGATPAAVAPVERVEPPPKPTIVALLSDAHSRGKDDPFFKQINGKLAQALADLQPLRPDYWLVNGDVTEQGIAAEYQGFHAIVDPVVPADRLLVTTGNHEFYDGALNDKSVTDAEELRRFRQAFGLTQPYNNYVVGGVHLVLLADEQWMGAPYKKDWAWLSADQLTWFERVLGEHRDLPTAVFMHQPLNETVVASQGKDAFGGSGQAEQLRAILGKNPQVCLWFSGHTHQRLEAPGQNVTQGATTFLALGSTAFLNTRTSGGFQRSYEMSQSRVLEIWPDKLVVKARDHAARKWLDDLTVTLPRR